MAQTKIIDYVGGTGATVGASTVTLVSSNPPNDINTLALLHVLATCPSTDDRAVWFQAAYLHKSALGVFTIDKRSDIVPSFATNGIKHADIDGVIVGGTTVELQATGDAGGPPIAWEAYVYFIRS